MRLVRRALPWLGVASVAALAALGAWSTRAERSPRPAAVAPASDLPAASSPEAPRRAFVGVVLPERAVELSPDLPTQLESIEVSVGDVVRTGQVLARFENEAIVIDESAARAAVERGEAELAAARIRLGRAEETRGRVLGVGERASSGEERSQAAAEVSLAEAAVQQEEAELAELRAALRDTARRRRAADLTSPCDGVVAAVYHDPGVRLSAGEPVLRVVDRGDVRVRFAVPPDERLSMREGSRLRIEAGDTRTLAIVTRLSPELDPASGHRIGEAVPEGEALDLFIGDRVRVSFEEP